MKKIYYLLFLGLILIYSAQAQRKSSPIRLKNSDLLGNRNLLKGKLSKELIKNIKFSNKYYAIVQFATTPGIEVRKELFVKKVVLFDYIPHNAFVAEIPESFKLAELRNYNISGLFSLNRQFKIAGKLLDHINKHSFSADKFIAISYFGTLTKEAVENELRKLGAQIISTKIKPERTIFINCSEEVVKKIADLPFVAYINEQ